MNPRNRKQSLNLAKLLIANLEYTSHPLQMSASIPTKNSLSSLKLLMHKNKKLEPTG